MEKKFQSWREETEVVLKDYMEENSLLKKAAEEAEGRERDFAQQVATLKHQLEKGDREEESFRYYLNNPKLLANYRHLTYLFDFSCQN